jgi:hypothetical protein
MYLAVGTNGSTGASTTTVTYSLDGSSWNTVANDPFAGVSGGVGYGVCWDGHQWIVVGTNVNPSTLQPSTRTIAVSSGGTGGWTAVGNDPFTGGAAYSVAFNGDQYIVAGTNGGSLFYGGTAGTRTLASTAKGVPLYGATLPAPANSTVLSYNSNKSVGNLKAIADDPFGRGNAYGIAWNGQNWLAVGTSIPVGATGVSGTVSTAAVSSDGVNWTKSNPFGLGIGYNATWSGNNWVLSGTNAPPFSTDSPTVVSVYGQNGFNWVNGTNPLSSTPNTVQYCVGVKNNITGAPINKVNSFGTDAGVLQYGDGNGNFTGNPSIYVEGDGVNTRLQLVTPTIYPDNIVDSVGSTGAAGEVLTSTGSGLQWAAGGGGGGAPVGGGGGGSGWNYYVQSGMSQDSTIRIELSTPIAETDKVLAIIMSSATNRVKTAEPASPLSGFSTAINVVVETGLSGGEIIFWTNVPELTL